MEEQMDRPGGEQWADGKRLKASAAENHNSHIFEDFRFCFGSETDTKASILCDETLSLRYQLYNYSL